MCSLIDILKCYTLVFSLFTNKRKNLSCQPNAKNFPNRETPLLYRHRSYTVYMVKRNLQRCKSIRGKVKLFLGIWQTKQFLLIHFKGSAFFDMTVRRWKFHRCWQPLAHCWYGLGIGHTEFLRASPRPRMSGWLIGGLVWSGPIIYKPTSWQWS